jgi:hypothetical protein
MGTIIFLSEREDATKAAVTKYKRAKQVFDLLPDSQEKWEAEYPKLQEKAETLRQTGRNDILERDGWL